jgi:septal ring factor EnvC (AmiA/AmiB activator)
MEGQVHLGARLSASLTVTQKPRADATTAERMAFLEREIERLREEHDRSLIAVTEQVGRVATDVARERNDRTRGNAELKRAVEDLAVGGLTLEAIGLAWLVVGVLLGTLPTTP